MEDQLRICIIVLMYYPIVGGAEVRAAKYAKQLQAFGHKVTILTLKHEKKWQDRECIDGVEIIRIGGLYKKNGTLRIGRLGHFPPDLLMLQLLWQQRHDYDLYYCAEMSTLSGIAVLLGKFLHKPVIISIPSTGYGRTLKQEEATLMADTLLPGEFLQIPYHDTVAGDISNIGKTAIGGNIMLKFLKKSAAYYQVLSKRGYTYLTELGFKKENIVYISGGVDTQKFCPLADVRPDPAQPERDILCVARLEYPKGIDVLLHAWSRMLREPAEWRATLKPRLLIVGIGTLEEPIKRIARELGLEESVKFLGLHQNVIHLLQRAWGFVLPSRWEGLPNALIEAMSCGLPCVATRVSGSEDLIQDQVNGLLVENEQPAEMAQALRRIIEDMELARRLGEEARNTIVRNYELAHVTRQTIEFYQHILAKDLQSSPYELKEKIES